MQTNTEKRYQPENTMIDSSYLPGPKRLQIKVFSHQSTVEKDEAINVFHSWIQKDLLNDLMIDVVDYSHVPSGPGIMLIGHESDYAYDELIAPGLRYTWKKNTSESFTNVFLQAMEHVVSACSLFESAEFGSKKGVRFNTSYIEVKILDRRLYPHTNATIENVQEVLLTTLQEVYGTEDIQVEYAAIDTRYPLSLRFVIPLQLSIETLLRSIRALPVLEPSN